MPHRAALTARDLSHAEKLFYALQGVIMFYRYTQDGEAQRSRDGGRSAGGSSRSSSTKPSKHKSHSRGRPTEELTTVQTLTPSPSFIKALREGVDGGSGSLLTETSAPVRPPTDSVRRLWTELAHIVWRIATLAGGLQKLSLFALVVLDAGEVLAELGRYLLQYVGQTVLTGLPQKRWLPELSALSVEHTLFMLAQLTSRQSCIAMVGGDEAAGGTLFQHLGNEVVSGQHLQWMASVYKCFCDEACRRDASHAYLPSSYFCAVSDVLGIMRSCCEHHSGCSRQMLYAEPMPLVLAMFYGLRLRIAQGRPLRPHEADDGAIRTTFEAHGGSPAQDDDLTDRAEGMLFNVGDLPSLSSGVTVTSAMHVYRAPTQRRTGTPSLSFSNAGLVNSGGLRPGPSAGGWTSVSHASHSPLSHAALSYTGEDISNPTKQKDGGCSSALNQAVLTRSQLQSMMLAGRDSSFDGATQLALDVVVTVLYTTKEINHWSVMPTITTLFSLSSQILTDTESATPVPRSHRVALYENVLNLTELFLAVFQSLHLQDGTSAATNHSDDDLQQLREEVVGKLLQMDFPLQLERIIVASAELVAADPTLLGLVQQLCLLGGQRPGVLPPTSVADDGGLPPRGPNSRADGLSMGNLSFGSNPGGPDMRGGPEYSSPSAVSNKSGVANTSFARSLLKSVLGSRPRKEVEERCVTPRGPPSWLEVPSYLALVRSCVDLLNHVFTKRELSARLRMAAGLLTPAVCCCNVEVFDLLDGRVELRHLLTELLEQAEIFVPSRRAHGSVPHTSSSLVPSPSAMDDVGERHFQTEASIELGSSSLASLSSVESPTYNMDEHRLTMTEFLDVVQLVVGTLESVYVHLGITPTTSELSLLCELPPFFISMDGTSGLGMELEKYFTRVLHLWRCAIHVVEDADLDDRSMEVLLMVLQRAQRRGTLPKDSVRHGRGAPSVQAFPLQPAPRRPLSAQHAIEDSSDAEYTRTMEELSTVFSTLLHRRPASMHPGHLSTLFSIFANHESSLARLGKECIVISFGCREMYTAYAKVLEEGEDLLLTPLLFLFSRYLDSGRLTDEVRHERRVWLHQHGCVKAVLHVLHRYLKAPHASYKFAKVVPQLFHFLSSVEPSQGISPNLQDSRFVDDLCGLLTRLRGTEYYIIVAQSIVDATTNHYEDDRSVTYSTRLIGSFQVPTVNCAAQKLIFLDLIPSIARCIHSRDMGLYHNLMEVVLIVLKCTGNVRSDRLVDFALTHQLSQLLPFLELPANLMDELPFSGSAHNLWAFWYPVLVNSPQRSEWRFSSSGGGVRLTVGRWPADGFTLSTYFRFDAIGPSVPIMDFLPGDLLGCCRGSSSGGGSTSASFLSVSGGDSVHLKRGTERVIVNERHPLQDFSAGKWLHVCVVLSPRHTLTFYLNGFRAGECAHRYYPAELEATVNIGFVDKSISDAWYSIGDIVIWGRELSPAEVEADGAYLDDLPRFPKLQVQDIPRSMATAAGAATASPVSDRLARYVPHAHTHHTILLNVIESGDSVPAFMAKLVGRHATPPTRWVDFHLLWASRGGVQHMLNWMETAPNPAPLEELVHLIAESIRRTILVSTMEPHLYLLLGYRLKQRGAFITKTMCDHLIYLCTSHFAVRGSNTCDGEVHRVIINRLMFEHVLSDVHLYAAMPKDVAMYLLHVMERLFCPSACPYAKRNALFVTPCRLVDPLLHGLASAATKLSVPLREAIVACIKQIVIAVDMEESLVHAVAAQAAILSPMEVAEASSQNTSVQVVLPSMAHAGVELSLRAAGHISVLLLRCLVDFSMHYASFWISFARVVDLPWYIACTSRFADPVSVLYATYLLFTSARHSPALADEVAKHQTIIIEVLRTHATVPELVLLLLALTMGATQHINLLSPQTPLLKQMEYALHGTSPEPDQLVAPIYIKVFLLHLHDTAHKSRFMKEEELLTSVLHRKRREGLLLRRYASLARTCVRLMHAIIHRRYPSALHKRPGPPLPPSRSTSHVLANEDGDTLTGKKGSSRGFASSPGSISSPTSASRAAIMRPRSPAPPPLLLEDVVSSAPTQARFIRSSRYSRAFAVLRVCVLLWIPVQAKRYTWRGAGGVAGSSNKYASTVFCLRTLRRYTSLPSMFHVFTTSPLQTSALSTLVSYISLDLLNPALQRWEEGMEQLCQTRLTPPLITSSTPQGHSHMSEVTESMTTESGPTVVVVGPHGTSSSVDGGERLIMHHGFGSASVGRECETPLTVTTANVGEPCFLHVATTSTTAETMGGGLGDREMSGSYPLVDGAESEPLPAVPATRTPAERVLLARRTASDSRHHHRHHLPSYASSQGDGSRRGAGFVAQESLSHSLPHVVASTMGTSRERDDCVCGGSEGSSSSPGEVGSHGYSSVGGPGSSYFGDQPPRLRVVGSTILFVENLSYVVQTFGDTLRHETVGVLAELIRVSLRTLPVQRWIGGPSYGSCGGLLFQMMLVTSANPSPENNVTNTLIRFFQLHVARAVRDELHSDLAVGEALGRGVNNSTTTTTVGSSTSNITAVSSSTSSSSDVFLFNVIHFTELLVDMVSLSLLNLEATITFLMTLLHLSKRAWQQRYADQLSEQVLRACISVLNRQAMREVSAEVMRCVASLGVLALRPGWMGKGVLESLLFVLLRVYTSAPPAWMSSAEAHLRQRYIIHLLIHLMKVYAGTTELRKALTVRTLTQRISLYEPMTAALLSDVDDHLRSKRFDAFLDANTSAMESLMSSRLKEKAELCYKSCMKARIEYIKRVKAFNELYQSLTELRAGHHPVDLHRCFVGRFSSFVACAPEVEAGQLPWFMLNAYSCEGTSSTTRSQKRRSSERGNGDGEASTVGAHEEEQGAESRFHYMDSERNYAPFVAHGGVGSKDGDATCRCEESCRHVCAIIPSGAGRYWPYMSVDPQPPFMDPRVKLRSSAVSLVRHLLAPEEVLRFISNGFRIHGLHAIPCLVLLTDRSVRLIGYSQVTRSGDIILCQHADSVEGESAELHDADSAVAMLSRHKRRSAFSAFTAMTKQIQRLLLDDPDEAVAQGFRDGSRVAQALKQSSTTKDLKDLFWTYPLMNFRCVRTLRYMHLSTAVEFELYFGDGALISLVDAGQSMNPAVRSEFLSRLSEVLRPHEVPCVDETDRPTAMRSMLVRWAAGSLSNLHYMLFLNEMAGRSRRDLNQYPILPWVLADYSAPSLDFEAAHTFRNLAYPMGAQSEARQCSVREKYANAAEFQASAEDGGSPHQQHHHHGGLGAFGRRTRRQTASVYPFHHGSHYSTSGGVLYYLLRVEPYTTFAKIFQGGELDLPSRLFSSIPASFMSCVNGPTDCKELLPEFYTNAAFLRNADHLALGTTDDGEVVNDVVLPPWAKQSTQVFTAVMRYALECSHTTQHLHQWIDLIFGVRRRGPAAAEALNVFQRMTYGEEVMQALQEARTPHDCDVIIAEVDNFGQTPIQLFQERHPAHHELEPVSNAARSVAASAFAFLSSPTPSINSSKPSSIVGGGAGGNTASSHIYTAAFDHEAHKILGMLLHAHDDPLTHFFLDEVADGILESTNTSADQLAAHFSGRRNPPVMSFCCTRGGKIACSYPRWLAVEGSNTKFGWFEKESRLMRFHCVGGDDDPLQQQQQQQHQHAHQQDCAGGACGGVLRCTSRLAFDSPGESCLRIRAVAVSRCESLVMVGVNSGTIYCLYPDVDGQQVLLHATLNHHTHPILGLVVEPHTSRAISFTCSSTDEPILWRLRPSHSVKMRRLATQSMLTRVSSPATDAHEEDGVVVAACLDKVDGLVVCATARCVCIFDGNGDAFGAGILPGTSKPTAVVTLLDEDGGCGVAVDVPSSREGKEHVRSTTVAKMTSICIYETCEWAAGIRVLVSGHEDGSVSLWRCTRLPPDTVAAGRIAVVEHHAIVGQTRGVHGAVRALHQVKAEVPHFLVGFEDGSVRSMRYEVPDMNANKGEKKSSK